MLARFSGNIPNLSIFCSFICHNQSLIIGQCHFYVHVLLKWIILCKLVLLLNVIEILLTYYHYLMQMFTHTNICLYNTETAREYYRCFVCSWQSSSHKPIIDGRTIIPISGNRRSLCLLLVNLMTIRSEVDYDQERP